MYVMLTYYWTRNTKQQPPTLRIDTKYLSNNTFNPNNNDFGLNADAVQQFSDCVNAVFEKILRSATTFFVR